MYMVTSDEPVKMVCSIHNVKSVKVSLRKNDDVLRRISVMSIFQKKLPHYLVTVLENLFDKYPTDSAPNSNFGNLAAKMVEKLSSFRFTYLKLLIWPSF